MPAKAPVIKTWPCASYKARYMPQSYLRPMKTKVVWDMKRSGIIIRAKAEEKRKRKSESYKNLVKIIKNVFRRERKRERERDR